MAPTSGAAPTQLSVTPSWAVRAAGGRVFEGGAANPRVRSRVVVRNGEGKSAKVFQPLGQRGFDGFSSYLVNKLVKGTV